MKTSLSFFTFMLLFTISIKAQVTQINNNNSLRVTVPLSSTKTIVISEIDSSIWVTDGTSLSGTVQISPDIKFEDTWALLSGKVIFRGSTPATGSEVYISDGTIAGTTLVEDIFAGTTGSDPGNMVLLNGFIYFIAETVAEGRELWKTDGTTTSIVKDINSGMPGAFDTGPGIFNELFSNGSYLLFAATTTASGKELWKSDGSLGGTVLLQEINPLTASSNPHSFIQYNSLVLFLATDDTHGEELWKTDGTTTELLKDINPMGDSCKASSFFRYSTLLLFIATDADHGEEVWKTDGTDVGTVMVKDINTGTSSSTLVELGPGFGVPIFSGFHLFNNKVYFRATDGASNGELWSSDGKETNTLLLKDIVPSAGFSFPIIYLPLSVNLPTKFIFSVADDGGSRSELWESDGTMPGTKLFKSFNSTDPGDLPFILLSFGFDISTGNLTYPLFQGNKFFFIANTTTNGRELWISDGVDSLVAHTKIVKDINSGAADGIDFNSISYLYTTTHLFFSADDGTNGNELWKTDGTDVGTEMVKDINPNAEDADPNFLLLLNGKVVFNATDGDDADNFDLFVVDGTFTALPVTLTDFTVSLKESDALLQWSTSQEINTKDFVIQRSYDGQHFVNIGTVQASGTVSNRHSYSFKDAGIINSGNEIAYYRLITSDKDGKTKNSNIISLRLNGKGKWNVVVLSNPVRENLRILLSGITAKVLLSIRDVSGRIIYSNSLQNVNGQISLNAKLKPGVHVLIVETNNERKVLQFIKQ